MNIHEINYVLKMDDIQNMENMITKSTPMDYYFNYGISILAAVESIGMYKIIKPFINFHMDGDMAIDHIIDNIHIKYYESTELLNFEFEIELIIKIIGNIYHINSYTLNRIASLKEIEIINDRK